MELDVDRHHVSARRNRARGERVLPVPPRLAPPFRLVPRPPLAAPLCAAAARLARALRRLLVQRQLEDDDGGVCYIETLDHDTYTGHFRLRLIEFTPTRLAFEIARKDHKYVEVTYDLGAKRFGEVKRIVHIVFGVRA